MADVHIYGAAATAAQLETNGLGALQAIDAVVFEELLTDDQSAQYRAQVSIPISDPLAEHFTVGAILKMETPEGDDYFRIKKTNKTLRDITAQAWHISYDLRNALITNRAWLDKTLVEAWPQIVDAGDLGGETRFSGSSDITQTNSIRIVRRNVLDAMIGKQDSSVLKRWGGELRRRKWQIDMLARRGTDRHVTVQYGKNLIGINDTVDATDVIHAVLPSYLAANDQPVVMPVNRSPRYAQAVAPRTVAIHYSDIQIGTDEDEYATAAEAEAEVTRRISEMWNQNADLPRASCEIDFVDLRRTEEYKNLTALEEIKLGDTIRALWHGHIDLTQRVISYEWDALREKYSLITLGSPRKSMSTLRSEISSMVAEQIAQTRPELVSSMIEATAAMNDVYANAMGYYRTVIVDEATGARHLYIHDQPTLDGSLFIATVPEAGSYMWTSTGWNGGDPTWQYGLTQDGNMLIRYIQAVGLNAEWIILQSGDSAETAITALQAGQLTIENHIQQGSTNLLDNPTWGGIYAPSMMAWHSGETVSYVNDRFKGMTCDEVNALVGNLTLDQFAQFGW